MADYIFDTDTNFIQLYKELKDTDKMADFYKTTTVEIRKHAEDIGFDIKNIKLGKLSKRDKEEIIEAYNKNTSTELAQRYNVSRGMITKLWRDNHLAGKENRRYPINQHYFNQIDTEEKAYWVGFIAADGCIYDSDDTRATRISFSLQAKDIEILEQFKKAISTTKPINHLLSNRNRPLVHLEISSNEIGNDLKKLGLQNRKTYLQTWVPFSDNKLQNAFIRGYFDGDGCISHNFDASTLHNVSITIVGYKKNLKLFAEYLFSQGIETRFTQDKRKEKYNVNISDSVFGSLYISDKANKIKFLDLIYPDNASVYLSRKYILSQKFKALCKINSKTWKINNADNKLGNIGEALHFSWGNTEITSSIAKGEEASQSIGSE